MVTRGSVISSCDFQRHSMKHTELQLHQGYELRRQPGKASLCGREFRKIRRQRTAAEITSEEVLRISESMGQRSGNTQKCRGNHAWKENMVGRTRAEVTHD